MNIQDQYLIELIAQYNNLLQRYACILLHNEALANILVKQVWEQAYEEQLLLPSPTLRSSLHRMLKEKIQIVNGYIPSNPQPARL